MQKGRRDESFPTVRVIQRCVQQTNREKEGVTQARTTAMSCKSVSSRIEFGRINFVGQRFVEIGLTFGGQDEPSCRLPRYVGWIDALRRLVMQRLRKTPNKILVGTELREASAVAVGREDVARAS